MDTPVGGMAWGARFTLGLLLLLPTVIQAQAKPLVYVTNSTWDTVSVIDTVTNTVEAIVVVGSGLRPLGIAMHCTQGGAEAQQDDPAGPSWNG